MTHFVLRGHDPYRWPYTEDEDEAQELAGRLYKLVFQQALAVVGDGRSAA